MSKHLKNSRDTSSVDIHKNRTNFMETDTENPETGNDKRANGRN